MLLHDRLFSILLDDSDNQRCSSVGGRQLEGSSIRLPSLPHLRLSRSTVLSAEQRRFIWNSGRKQTDPYEIIGVSRTATPAEVKKAYFREAKKCHPDLNPGDPQAKARFQRLTAAYEAIQNPGKSTDYYETSYGDSQGHQAEEVFDSLWEDVAVVKEAVVMYGKDLQEEIEMIIDAAKEREWNKVWEAAKQHKGIILGVFVPLLVVFRFPVAALLAGRVLFSLVGSVAVPMFYSGHAEVLTKWLWKRIVAEAKAKAAVRNASKRDD